MSFLEPLIRPMAWVLAALYNLTSSYGFSVILLTLAVMIVVTPLTIKGTRSMMAMQKFQPEIRRLQQEFKGDRPRLNEEMLGFYRSNNINPMGSCLPLLVQAPVFIVLYRLIKGLTEHEANSTAFAPRYVDAASKLYTSLQGKTTMPFLGIDIARSAASVLKGSFVSALPYMVIIAIATASSYIQQRQVSGRSPDAMNPTQKTLMRVMPLGMAVFSFSLPAALGLYFVTSNLYRVAQQWYISKALYGNESAAGSSALATDKGSASNDAVKEIPPRAVPRPETTKPAQPRGTGRVTPSKKPDGVKPSVERSRRAPSRPSTNGQAPGVPARRQPFGPSRGPSNDDTSERTDIPPDERRG